jgi:hypothetical protein
MSSGDDGGLRQSRQPFSFVRYWGKIFVGVLLVFTSAVLLLAVTSRLNALHGRTADFVRLVWIGACGGVTLLGILFIRWAFAEGRRAK